MRGGIGHKLRIGTSFGQFLMHAVNIAQDRLCLDDILAVHGHFYSQDAVGGRMLWPYIEDKGFIMPWCYWYGHGI